jgi:cytochrome c551/c552
MPDLSQLASLNPFALIAIFTSASLLLVVVASVVFWLLSNGISSFLKTSPEAAVKQTAFEKSFTAQALNPPKKPMTANAEPFVIAGVGFAIFLLAGALFLNQVPGPSQREEVKEPVVAANALPSSGDFAAHVAALPAGNADNGTKLYTGKGCVGCHSLEDGKRLVGPSFYGLYKTAPTREAGVDAKAYLYKSIVKPNDYVVETYQSGLMPQNYAQQLSPQEMSDLLAWIERDQNK